MTAPITCPRCGATSSNPNDARWGYCGRCHDWTAPVTFLGVPIRVDASLADDVIEIRGETTVVLHFRPPVERLAEGWDQLAPELDPVIAALPHEQRMRLLSLVVQVGMAVEELRAERGVR